MLPRSTSERMRRESSNGKQSGRTQEIQRLIGRSLRSIIDLKKLGEYQINIDCDVIQADGGTRTASISGAWVALRQSINNLLSSRDLLTDPIIGCIGAVSCGIYENVSILDLDYDEDSKADADANFVLTDYGSIVEVQATAETIPFSQEKYSELFALARKGISEINIIQKKVFET
jgi:ribonuclease PH